MTGTNQAQVERWNAQAGKLWADAQEVLDARLRAFGEAALDAAKLGEGARVLDVGCGCADTTLSAAARVGTTGHVLGLDISRPMLARGRERTKGVPSIELREADASTFRTDEPFDAVISRFGIMFFDDPPAAFGNLRRATRSGGILSFACWQPLEQNPWAAVPLSGVLRVLPPPAPTPPREPGPFAFADPSYVREVLTGGGYRDVELTPFSAPVAMGSTLEEVVGFAAELGPASRALEKAPEDVRPRAMEMLRQTLAPLAPGFTLEGAIWVVTARA